MDNEGKEGFVCKSGTENEGEDVYSCKQSDASSVDHLVVMVHGILGRLISRRFDEIKFNSSKSWIKRYLKFPGMGVGSICPSGRRGARDWKFAAELFVSKLPDKVFVHCSERNTAKLSLDGVDVMGERLAEEVLDVIKRKPDLRKISFVAHSVGGLVARYTIGRLYRPPNRESTELSDTSCERESNGTIAGLEPINFITVATPHLGSRGNKQVPFLFGVPAIERLAGCVIHLIFRRTGQHLFLTDDDEGKPPLLRRMLEDRGELQFMSALGSFQRRVAYSNVGYDHIVGWRTSSIRRNNELPKWEDFLDEKYPHIVYEERCKASDGEQCESVSTDNNGLDELEEELVIGLSRLTWEKVDVSFHKSKLKFAAHSVIQVKEHYMHTEGADVIQHMIDHFIL